jgi:hypothetical protein
MDGEDGIAAVVVAGEGEGELHVVEVSGKVIYVGDDIGSEGFVALRLGEVEQLEGLAGFSLDAAPSVDLLAGVGEVAHNLLGFGGVVPETGLGGLSLQSLDL